MLAVMNGHFSVAQILVEHGAQVDCADKNLHTALHAAVSGTYVLVNIAIIECMYCNIPVQGKVLRVTICINTYACKIQRIQL